MPQSPLPLALVTTIAAGAATVVIPFVTGVAAKLWLSLSPGDRAGLIIVCLVLGPCVVAILGDALSGKQSDDPW